MARLPSALRDPLKGLYYRLLPELLWTRGAVDCDWWVVSHGGVKTTMLMEFLARYGSTNDPYADRRNLKHLARPPRRLRPRRMFVYVYGDPVRSVLSLYRREYAQAQSRKLGYLGSVLAQTVDGYAARGVDALRITRHLCNWLGARLPVPIAYVDSERLWDDVPALLARLGVDAPLGDFPAELARGTDVDAIDPQTRQHLESIYTPYRTLVQGLPAVTLRSPS